MTCVKSIEDYLRDMGVEDRALHRGAFRVMKGSDPENTEVLHITNADTKGIEGCFTSPIEFLQLRELPPRPVSRSRRDFFEIQIRCAEFTCKYFRVLVQIANYDNNRGNPEDILSARLKLAVLTLDAVDAGMNPDTACTQYQSVTEQLDAHESSIRNTAEMTINIADKHLETAMLLLDFVKAWQDSTETSLVDLINSDTNISKSRKDRVVQAITGVYYSVDDDGDEIVDYDTLPTIESVVPSF